MLEYLFEGNRGRFLATWRRHGCVERAALRRPEKGTNSRDIQARIDRTAIPSELTEHDRLTYRRACIRPGNGSSS